MEDRKAGDLSPDPCVSRVVARILLRIPLRSAKRRLGARDRPRGCGRSGRHCRGRARRACLGKANVSEKRNTLDLLVNRNVSMSPQVFIEPSEQHRGQCTDGGKSSRLDVLTLRPTQHAQTSGALPDSGWKSEGVKPDGSASARSVAIAAGAKHAHAVNPKLRRVIVSIPFSCPCQRKTAPTSVGSFCSGLTLQAAYPGGGRFAPRRGRAPAHLRVKKIWGIAHRVSTAVLVA
jgi:hypothetical protein